MSNNFDNTPSVPLPASFETWTPDEQTAWLGVINGAPLKPSYKFAPPTKLGGITLRDVVAILATLDLRVTADLLTQLEPRQQAFFKFIPEFRDEKAVNRKLYLNEATARIAITRHNAETQDSKKHTTGYFRHNVDPAVDFVLAVTHFLSGLDPSDPTALLDKLDEPLFMDLLDFEPSSPEAEQAKATLHQRLDAAMTAQRQQAAQPEKGLDSPSQTA